MWGAVKVWKIGDVPDAEKSVLANERGGRWVCGEDVYWTRSLPIAKYLAFILVSSEVRELGELDSLPDIDGGGAGARSGLSGTVGPFLSCEIWV